MSFEDPHPATRGERSLDEAGLDRLIRMLTGDGWTVLGPVARDGAIGLESVRGIADLPRGLRDEQEKGRYRLVERGDRALFGFVHGPQSLRKVLLPPEEVLYRVEAVDDGFAIRVPDPGPTRLAVLGARGCDLAALAIQDRVWSAGEHRDARYQARREGLLVIAVQCGEPGGTCFCVSMGTGPRAEAGYDLALTEVLEAGEPRYFVEIGSDRGADLMERLGAAAARDRDRQAAAAVSARARERMGRRMDTEGLAQLLVQEAESPHWQAVADRCLACTNCTMVCPTCFCNTSEEKPSLTGEVSERVRLWDSCFTSEFSYLHGGSVRSSVKSRYRQWLTHKLSTWHDQFGTSGCVGCGRCITWCPPGIDLTEEVAALRSGSGEVATRSQAPGTPARPDREGT